MADRMVVDASVAAKWFLKDATEQDVDLADEILVALLGGNIEVHAPQIFFYEICGLLTKACLTRDSQTGTSRLSKQDAVEHVRDFFDLPINVHGITVDEGAEALDMAVDHHKGHYDMAYVRLARLLNCQWCTAEDKFFKALRPDFPLQHIVRLSSLRDTL